jgi:uncharacterized protein (DUF2062 family)
MPPEEHRDETAHRHARRARAKRFLRFLPRRAVIHKYPIIGRFADFARKRAYLWSFRIQNLRPAFYAGSILSLLPVMGVQLPVALALSLILRANFMVLGGLQFITNPFTAVPIYYTTHQLGVQVIEWSGFGQSIDVIEEPRAEKDTDPLEPPRLEAAQVIPETPAKIHWTKRVGTSINALAIGGIIAGTVLGGILDVAWRLLSAAHYRRHPPRQKLDSNSTGTIRPPE